jgi:initiation factor 1A
MVKNFGGKNSKKLGRKFVSNSYKGSNKLRLIEDEDELFGCVLKLLGNGMCHVYCGDDVQRLCIIRNKFRGRGKRDNTLKIGTIVMIGKRSWESKSDDENSKCDLVEVYNESEVKRLKDSVSFDWDKFKHIENMANGEYSQSKEEGLDFEFANDNGGDAELEKMIIDETAEKNEIIETVLENNDEFDIDDI